MKADAFVDWDWLASETVLKLAPAEPDAVDVEVPAVADVPAPMLVSKVEPLAATISAVEPIPLTVTLLSVSLSVVPSAVSVVVNSLVVKEPLMVPSDVEEDSVPLIFEYAFW